MSIAEIMFAIFVAWYWVNMLAWFNHDRGMFKQIDDSDLFKRFKFSIIDYFEKMN